MDARPKKQRDVLTADACDNAAMTVYGGMYPCCKVVKVVKGDEITSRGAFLSRGRVTLGVSLKLRLLFPHATWLSKRTSCVQFVL